MGNSKTKVIAVTNQKGGVAQDWLLEVKMFCLSIWTVRVI